MAVQVKSMARDFNATSNKDYLAMLEVPFFVAVVRQKPPSIGLYSGEAIPVLFPYIGGDEIKKLTLSFRQTPFGNIDDYLDFDRNTGVAVVRLRRTHTIDADTPMDALAGVRRDLTELCLRVLWSISGCRINQFVFMLGLRGERAESLAGRVSAERFYGYHLLHLMAIFRNLEWIFQRPRQINSNSQYMWLYRHYRTFKHYYASLEAIDKTLPDWLVKSVADCDRAFERLRPVPCRGRHSAKLRRRWDYMRRRLAASRRRCRR